MLTTTTTASNIRPRPSSDYDDDSESGSGLDADADDDSDGFMTGGALITVNPPGIEDDEDEAVEMGPPAPVGLWNAGGVGNGTLWSKMSQEEEEEEAEDPEAVAEREMAGTSGVGEGPQDVDVEVLPSYEEAMDDAVVEEGGFVRGDVKGNGAVASVGGGEGAAKALEK